MLSRKHGETYGRRLLRSLLSAGVVADESCIPRAAQYTGTPFVKTKLVILLKRRKSTFLEHSTIFFVVLLIKNIDSFAVNEKRGLFRCCYVL